MADPDVDTVYYWVGANPTVNTGRLMIDLKPMSQRKASATEVINRLRRATAKVPGHRAVRPGAPGRADRRAGEQDAVPVHAAGPQRRRAVQMGADRAGQARRAAGIAGRDRRPAGDRAAHDAEDRPRRHRPARASRRKPSTTRSTMPSASGRSPRSSASSTSTASSSRSSRASRRTRRRSSSSTCARRQPDRWCRCRS